jgi:DNA-binding NarL/FixJ family response regulator
MRLIVIGNARERRELRDRIERAPPDIVAEFDSLADAREAGIAADAMLVATAAAGSTGSADEGEDLDSGPLLVEPLTPREIDVLELVARGLPNKAVAARLGISDQTVKFHLASLSGKLGAVNRSDAVRRAVRRGLVTL